MCSGSKWKLSPTGLAMEGEFQMKEEGVCDSFSVLLELAASNDVTGFKTALEEEGHDVDQVCLWYGRRIGSKKMGFEERTSLMIASMFGSKDVLNYILESGAVDVNRACGSDKATALHCAAAGGSAYSSEVVKRLLDASADPNSVDANGNKPGDLIAHALNLTFYSNQKALGIILKDSSNAEIACELPDYLVDELEEISTPRAAKDGIEKKEYPIDLTLPDIKNGIYGTDEFRMYMFKVKPCSRAYSHDWTECPFVHPGENARRRDPRKYHYSCVPCPEFRKGSCRQADACDYAHGIFECWLHPAQYRTRLCKDETGCNRRVCFFAHKPEELRPLYASTGSAVPSPRSFSTSTSLDIGSISPLALGSPSVFMPSTSTPPMTPSGASSPMGGAGAMWQNQSNLVPPTLQLPGSRLKTTSSARDMDLDVELLGLESQRRWQQQLMDEISGLSSPSGWNKPLATSAAFASSGDLSREMNRLGGVKPTNLEGIFGSFDPAMLPHLQSLSLDVAATQLQSPTGIQMRQNTNQLLRSSYPVSLSSSPMRTSSIDPSGSAVLNSRSSAFAKRSQSFIDRSPATRLSGLSPYASPTTAIPSALSDWGSLDGKLDWGIQGGELNKLRKSASFGVRSNSNSSASATPSMPAIVDEPNVSWVQSLNGPSVKPGKFGFDEHQQRRQYHLNSGSSEKLPAWVEQFYMEKEQMVA